MAFGFLVLNGESSQPAAATLQNCPALHRALILLWSIVSFLAHASMVLARWAGAIAEASLIRSCWHSTYRLINDLTVTSSKSAKVGTVSQSKFEGILRMTDI